MPQLSSQQEACLPEKLFFVPPSSTSSRTLYFANGKNLDVLEECMKNSSIGWTHHTFDPWWGCTKVSPGCANCYAESMSNRFGKDIWGKGKERQRTSAANWRDPLAWDREAAKTGERKRVFCASMAGVFDTGVPDDWRFNLFELIERTPNLDWLLLSKRPENIQRMIAEIATPICEAWDCEGVPPYNVWLGTSVEDQRRADDRIPAVLKTPAVVHFLSVEPLLAPVDLGNLVDIEWTICGGESGPLCRPMNLQWAGDVRDQCSRHNTTFFMKQLGGHPNKRENIESFPLELRIREFPT